jgi:hypothetical protein
MPPRHSNTPLGGPPPWPTDAGELQPLQILAEAPSTEARLHCSLQSTPGTWPAAVSTTSITPQQPASPSCSKVQPTPPTPHTLPGTAANVAETARARRRRSMPSSRCRPGNSRSSAAGTSTLRSPLPPRLDAEPRAGVAAAAAQEVNILTHRLPLFVAQPSRPRGGRADHVRLGGAQRTQALMRER